MPKSLLGTAMAKRVCFLGARCLISYTQQVHLLISYASHCLTKAVVIFDGKQSFTEQLDNDYKDESWWGNKEVEVINSVSSGFIEDARDI